MSQDFGDLVHEAYGGAVPGNVATELGDGLFEVAIQGFPETFRVSIPPRACAAYDYLSLPCPRTVDVLAYLLSTFSSQPSGIQKELYDRFPQLLESRRLAHAWWAKTVGV